MKIFNRNQLLYISIFVILFIGISSVYLYNAVLQSEEQIIQNKKNFTDTAVNQLVTDIDPSLQKVWEAHLKEKDRITKAEERVADSLLSEKISSILTHFDRVEGGLYFFELDNFIGYSFPTIEPPKPAFGPPPRSYNYIREQVRESIYEESQLTYLHKFDPAIFPLTTKPIYINGEIVGAAWARIHIERELAAMQTIQSGTFFFTIGIILLILGISVYAFWVLRKRVKSLKQGLELMKSNPEYRLREHKGMFGFITRSINEMTDIHQRDRERSKKLERRLFQKEKMASLGNLIAGTAHEINTPISIIKTRIQIWERKLKKLPPSSNEEGVISEESLKMVRSEIDRVSDLIKRLLFFSKPIPNQKQEVDINNLLNHQINQLHELFPEYQFEFQTNLDPNLPDIYADKHSIRQVFINVLNNAVQASPQNCKLIISSYYNTEKQTITIIIRDFGIGVPGDIRNQIFDPFFTTKETGAGLGLSISSEIIKAHQGEITFTSPGSYPDNEFETEIFTKDSSGTFCIIELPLNSSKNSSPYEN